MKLADKLGRTVEVGRSIGLDVEAGSGTIKALDIPKITAQVLDGDVGKEDVLTQWSNVNFAGPQLLNVGGHGNFLMTTHAFEQMSSRLGIPSSYLKKCPIGGSAGQQEQLQYWREQIDDREVMLRVQKSKEDQGVLRAVLAKSYEPIDNQRIWGWTTDLLERHDGWGVTYANFGPTSSHLRVMSLQPANLGTEQTPDYHYYGLHIGDSEVGSRAFTVDFLLFRLACFNGSVHQVEGGHLMHQKHIHVDYPTMRREFFMTVDGAVNYKDQLFGVIDQAKSERVEDPHTSIRRLVRHYKMGKEFADKVVAAYEAEPSPTRFGLVQAFTRAAKQLPIDQRLAVEHSAGDYLQAA